MVKIIKRATDANSSAMYELMIDSSTDLEKIDFTCAAGSIAYTAGFGSIYHMNTQGQWVKV